MRLAVLAGVLLGMIGIAAGAVLVPGRTATAERVAFGDVPKVQFERFESPGGDKHYAVARLTNITDKTIYFRGYGDTPEFPQRWVERLHQGSWVEFSRDSCGTALELQALAPGKSVEFNVGLSHNTLSDDTCDTSPLEHGEPIRVGLAYGFTPNSVTTFAWSDAIEIAHLKHAADRMPK